METREPYPSMKSTFLMSIGASRLYPRSIHSTRSLSPNMSLHLVTEAVEGKDTFLPLKIFNS